MGIPISIAFWLLLFLYSRWRSTSPVTPYISLSSTLVRSLFLSLSLFSLSLSLSPCLHVFLCSPSTFSELSLPSLLFFLSCPLYFTLFAYGSLYLYLFLFLIHKCTNVCKRTHIHPKHIFLLNLQITARFLDENVEIDMTRRSVTLPRQCCWYVRE